MCLPLRSDMRCYREEDGDDVELFTRNDQVDSGSRHQTSGPCPDAHGPINARLLTSFLAGNLQGP